MPEEAPEPTGPSFDELINKRSGDEQERVQQEVVAAAEQLKKLMAESTDLQHTSYMVLLGYRLIQWAASKAAEFEGMTNLMLQILVHAQEEKARMPFGFVELVDDLEKHQFPWLESQRREAIVRDTSRKRRLRDLDARIRRKDIPLPFHSMTSACGEGGFTHEKTIVLVGHAEAVQLVLRYCTLEYQRAGGLAALLSSTPAYNEQIAKIVLPLNSWRNGGEIYGNLSNVLSPVTRGLPNKAVGLLAVDNLDELLLVSSPPMDRDRRVMLATNMMMQYQAERGMAMLLGLCTDDDPPGMAATDVYPWLEGLPHVRVALEDSKLVGGSANIVIGNDVMPRYQLEERLKGE